MQLPCTQDLHVQDLCTQVCARSISVQEPCMQLPWMQDCTHRIRACPGALREASLQPRPCARQELLMQDLCTLLCRI